MSGVRLLAAVLGFWILMRGINKDASGRTLIDKLVGNKASQSPLLGLALPNPVVTAPSTPGGSVNPFPGATGSRLDQGLDLTSKDFLAPFAGKILVSRQTDPGWAGGGYLAIQNAANPSQVIYMAEGLSPVVQAGARVQAGQRLAIPVSNPYNGIVGNIESGPANPNNPAQPLAQATTNKRGVVDQFYNWLLGIGGPKATSTAGAGYA
jgi:hypothetical protein